MDDFIDFFFRNGLYVILVIAAIKVAVIVLYRGLDLAYIFENFFVIYSSPGIEPNLKRKKFRTAHNIITVIFYLMLVLWMAITFVVKYAA
jgi:hypothetical protein